MVVVEKKELFVYQKRGGDFREDFAPVVLNVFSYVIKHLIKFILKL